MATRNYARLGWQVFGEHLLSTEDLDPLYGALTRTGMPENQLKRWLLAYWCYYAAGTVCRIVEAPNYWEAMYRANEDNWPHGFERRHFRGKAARRAVWELEARGEPERIVDSLVAPTFGEVSERTQRLRLFGPWISWKVGDMLERVMRVPIDFSDATLAIYEEPVKGAALIRFGDWEHLITNTELEDTTQMVIRAYRKLLAPPWRDRPINVQEVETIFCKTKAHHRGFYPRYNDTVEIGHSLHSVESDLAQEMLKHMPKVEGS